MNKLQARSNISTTVNFHNIAIENNCSIASNQININIMPINKATVCWYSIEQCGYYRHRHASEGPVFGNMAAMLTDLKRWSSNTHFGATATFEVSEQTELHTAYLLDSRSQGDDWLLTIWNQTTMTDGMIPSVMANSRAGHADVVVNEVIEGSIPGFPTYFYFCKQKEAFAAIRFTNPSFGQATLSKYLDSFLKMKSRHVVFSQPDMDNAEINIAGYRATQDGAIQNLNPTFKARVKTRPAEIDSLRRNVNRITKIINKEVLSIVGGEPQAFWQSLLGRLNLRARQDDRQTARVQYDIATSVTLPELNEIIQKWNESQEYEHDDWANIGFKLTGESNPVWLSGSLARSTIEFDVEKNTAGVVMPESLLGEITRHRDTMLTLIEP